MALPSWVTDNLKSPKSRKTLIRCWIASWVAFVIILPNQSLTTLGNAAFFTALVSMIVAPSMPLQLFVLAIAMVMMGFLVGWGLGSAAMRGALAARSQLLLKHTLQQAQQRAASSQNPDAEFKAEVFQGQFLDTDSSVVFGVFLAAGTFFLALARAYLPKLMVLSIFGTISLDVFCSYGPLFPFAQYTILNSILISASCYAAIGVVLITLVFPETINHAHLEALAGFCGALKGLVAMQDEALDSTHETVAAMKGKISGTRAGLVAKWQGLQGTAVFINLEFSWGKWNGDDILELEQSLLGIITRIAGLCNWTTVLSNVFSTAGLRANDPKSPIETGDAADKDSVSEKTAHGHGHDTLILQQLYNEQLEAEQTHSLTLEDSLPRLKDATSDLRQACVRGLSTAQTVIDSTNKKRWQRAAKDVEERIRLLDESIAGLKGALEDFKLTKRQAMLDPYVKALRPETEGKQGQENLPHRSLHISLVFAVNLIITSEMILAFLNALRALVDKRKKTRLWAPKGLRTVWKAVRSKGGAGQNAAAGEDVVPEEEDEEEEIEYGRDPDSKPPANVFQRVMDVIHRSYKWSKTPEALFAFKYTFVSIALWLPAVFKSSAAFNYEQKGLWALIMAQTTLNIYASDHIYNLVTRSLGTFIGAVIGLLVWYLGNASSNGNPYGTAAAVGVFLVPVMFIRLFAPLQYLTGVLMGCATFVLVVGYSWIDAKLPLFGNPGIGWPIAWKRFVLVMIGCGASFIMMCLPPQSGRKAVRLRNATILTNVADLYAFMMSKWIAMPDVGNELKGENGTDTPKEKSWKNDFRKQMREKIVSISTEIGALRQQTAMAVWEGNIRGAWPVDEYQKLIGIESDMISALAQIGGALTLTDDDVRIAYLRHTKVVNPNFVTDVMSTFILVAQSLRTGQPLHQVLDISLLDRALYHGKLGTPRPEVDASNGGTKPITMPRVDEAQLRSLDYAYYATALVGVFQLAACLDELRQITGRLCGTVPLEGFGQWRIDFERSHS
ncbi:hypothetical protein PUNSTDRAFT_107508 [Punctularia strigosozonata HHB-11173 SS5]|uniref:ER transporter 6TM N-terminal domain-containing protein n=1 Tax=Punctularia strigosozonata (strain HHB-11173) TaxID=741275 RepID=R7S4Q2_PUNST|nr:uncharacterized protein PUNSTDRAFT_107508 [Punctularia strigosozonata HHB-11173 SS5]EIN05213.1 hypothetical protein PUNSTDRAFT_107508 [Punctularia strigosozonata HHB-11173 SS5]